MGKKEQLLLLKKFGDDSDRALIKPNGNLTILCQISFIIKIK